ncbi:hypothetical protein K443DRAFT_672835 [Laccaria amethystina LaAM-08-1]|uniref:DUF6534 domain-containing protein n=1 Tax=Laccaria amethystina LaAM-08-1 TaxID=1095629 RepID=A0A0C9YIT1_9AGAR|nr:hypothetical protein K443DRAFT_672835 [Laccaria amethystina LaAM-08-1]
MSGIELPPGAVVLTLKELESSLGVFFVGYVVATIAYGFTFFQSYDYFSRYPFDHWTIKYTVASLFILDTAITVLISHALYHYLVLLYPFTLGLINATHTYCAAIGLSIVAVFIVQIFYSAYIWTVSKNAFLSGALAFVSTAAFALGLAFTAKISHNHKFTSLAVHGVKGVIASGQALSAVAGLVTFGALCFYSKSTQDVAIHPLDIAALYEDFITYFLARGCAATIVQFGLFFSFLTMPTKAVWMPFFLVASKLFINSLLTLLNSREVHHVHGMNKTALSSRKTDSTSQSTSVPRSNRFDVVDSKVEVSHTIEHGDDPTGSKAPPLADDDAAPWHEARYAENKSDKTEL